MLLLCYYTLQSCNLPRKKKTCARRHMTAAARASCNKPSEGVISAHSRMFTSCSEIVRHAGSVIPSTCLKLTLGTDNVRPDGSSSSSSLRFGGVKHLQMSVWLSWVLHSQNTWPDGCHGASLTTFTAIFTIQESFYVSFFLICFASHIDWLSKQLHSAILGYFRGLCRPFWGERAREKKKMMPTPKLYLIEGNDWWALMRNTRWVCNKTEALLRLLLLLAVDCMRFFSWRNCHNTFSFSSFCHNIWST